MKKSAKKAKAAGPEMPGLVTAMMKLVERLEVLEKKTDLMLGRVSNLPAEVRQAVANLQRPESSRPAQTVPHPGNNAPQNQAPRERILYKAVCADCCKSCEVPFRPSGDRPVYCPACFAIRKAGHVPKDPTANVVVPQHLRELKNAPAVPLKASAGAKTKKKASKTAKKSSKKKK
jgi:CxxC-x17-CxxC domain-containing protein